MQRAQDDAEETERVLDPAGRDAAEPGARDHDAWDHDNAAHLDGDRERPAADASEEFATTHAALRRRLRLPEPVTARAAGLAWAGAVAVFALALVLRLWGLGTIDELIFDETYYVKDGYTLTQQGVEMDWPEEPDAAWERGEVDGYLDTGAYIVHPSLGKWLIGAGMTALGADNPWGWRIAVALLGSLSVLMLARIGRRLFRSTTVGLIAALLLAVDGLHLVHSRTSLLDLPLTFFVLAGFGALLIDRDRHRERLARQTARLRVAGITPPRLGLRGGWRPWRITGGVLLGMACSVKWSGLYFLAVFGIMIVLWDWWARRTIDQRDWLLGGLWRDAIPAFLATVGTAAVTYLASWSGWLASPLGYGRRWAAEQDGGGTGFPPLDALWSLWHYHRQAYEFHIGLDSEHPWQSNPWGWPLMIRPTNFYYRSYDYGEMGCQVERCASHILAVGNPLIWWLGTLAVPAALVIGLWFRDGRALAALSGIIAGYLPWALLYEGRTIFTFYAVVFEPWMVLCLAYVMGLVIGPRRAEADRRLAGGLFVGSLLVLIVLVSAFFWPVWTGQVIDAQQWEWRMWLPSWT